MKVSNVLILIKNSIMIAWKRHRFLIPPTLWKKYTTNFLYKLMSINNKQFLNPFIIKEYNYWLDNNKNSSDKRKYKKFNYNPLISIVIPVYNLNREYLVDCFESILAQKYVNFEICIADDHSTNEETIKTLQEYEKKDSRIKVIYREENGHISKATNTALSIAQGEFIALMDDDDILTNNALYKVVEALNKNPKIDMIYSDEDKLNMDNKFCEPHFKPNFSLIDLYGGNYICHFTVIRKKLVNKIGGFREEYVGAQDFDLFLRITENTNKIYHIPEILYHWRKVPGSTAETVENKEYAINNGKKAVIDSLKRRNIDADVIVPIKCTHYIVDYKCKTDYKITIVIVENNISNIKDLIKALQNNISYKNYEICIVTSKSMKKKVKFKTSKKIFIYDKINNISQVKCINTIIDNCSGDMIVFMSGKIKFNSGNIFNKMLNYASQKEIGAVGPKILNFDKTIQSAGMILSKTKLVIPAFSNYFSDSCGLYGRLVVPYEYSVISSFFLMCEKSKILKVKKLDENYNLQLSFVDLCLKLCQGEYKNVVLPYLSICQKSFNPEIIAETSISSISKFVNKWSIYYKNDAFYNKSLSTNMAFMLEQNKKKEKNNDKK